MEENWKAEYDSRQYQLMAERLKQFNGGTLSLGVLIRSLTALVEVLEAPEFSWREQILSELGNLKVLRGVVRDRVERGESQATIDDRSWRAIVMQIEHLVDEKLRTLKPEG